MTNIVYECVQRGYRIEDEAEKPASFACRECRGIMKHVSP